MGAERKEASSALWQVKDSPETESPGEPQKVKCKGKDHLSKQARITILLPGEADEEGQDEWAEERDLPE